MQEQYRREIGYSICIFPVFLFFSVVKTRRGEMRVPVWFNGRGHPPRGSLFIPFFDERLLVNELTLGDIDPISKEPDYKKCAATVLRATVAAAPH